MAEIIPFPPAKRVAYVRRQAEFVLSMTSDAGERHIARQVSLQRQTLGSKGIDPELVDQACADFESALRSELWRAVFSRPGAA